MAQEYTKSYNLGTFSLRVQMNREVEGNSWTRIDRLGVKLLISNYRQSENFWNQNIYTVSKEDIKHSTLYQNYRQICKNADLDIYKILLTSRWWYSMSRNEPKAFGNKGFSV